MTRAPVWGAILVQAGLDGAGSCTRIWGDREVSRGKARGWDGLGLSLYAGARQSGAICQ